MSMIVTIIVILIAAFIYDEIPFLVKLAITVLAFVISDPIPVLDELFFTYKFIGNVSKALKISSFFDGLGKK